MPSPTASTASPTAACVWQRPPWLGMVARTALNTPQPRHFQRACRACTHRVLPVMMVRDVRHDHAHMIHVQEQEQGRGKGQQQPRVSEPQVQAPPPRPQGPDPKPGSFRVVHHSMITPCAPSRHSSLAQHEWPRRNGGAGGEQGRLTGHSRQASSHCRHASMPLKMHGSLPNVCACVAPSRGPRIPCAVVNLDTPALQLRDHHARS